MELGKAEKGHHTPHPTPNTHNAREFQQRTETPAWPLSHQPALNPTLPFLPFSSRRLQPL